MPGFGTGLVKQTLEAYVQSTNWVGDDDPPTDNSQQRFDDKTNLPVTWAADLEETVGMLVDCTGGTADECVCSASLLRAAPARPRPLDSHPSTHIPLDSHPRPLDAHSTTPFVGQQAPSTLTPSVSKINATHPRPPPRSPHSSQVRQ